ncbi:TlpA disulfide reductase family protein [Pseudoalteromonas tunicata]|uniref:TlpA disulfide reductase family protein n=1 Tax=Pseudoalteromonas tunicata TaxID=314281 RepID=UPI00273DCCFC|nr:TlpA disulfide reductase family protein [Pseudoalteromonas tunicata]MDP5214542.1 TlpA disulfide reductase family protein [Pseudoalteromonas tunicata]
MLKKIIATFCFLSSIALSGASLAQSNDPSTQLNTLLQTHQGKVIYLDFWASWCGPCKKSFPWMNEMQTRYAPDGFTVITVNLDKEALLANEFLATHPANFPVVYDSEGILAKQYKLVGMPSSYLIGKDGEIKRSHAGFINKQIPTYEQEIQLLLQQSVIKH